MIKQVLLWKVYRQNETPGCSLELKYKEVLSLGRNLGQEKSYIEFRPILK